MNKLVGISLYDNGSINYFDPGDYDLKRNTTVLVQTEKGLEFGRVEIPVIEMDKTLTSNYDKVLRIASKKDYASHCKNLTDEEEALKKCQQLSQKFNLDMQIIDAKFTFDRSQLMFKFLADGRVDFRELAKELANRYKTRIELRQIGVRDKAKVVGGCGMCGQKLCCSRFSDNFTSVSINMAKNQNLSLNPTKINGVCGRLLCCLRYEDDTYKQQRKDLPKMNEMVVTKEGKGKVISLDVINNKYAVQIPDGQIVEVILENGSN